MPDSLPSPPRPGAAPPSAHARALQARRTVLRRVRLAVLLGVALLGAGAARTFLARGAHTEALAASARAQARVSVRTIAPASTRAALTIELPGTLQGQTEAPLYARADGYVLRWLHDIGSPVRQGDLLAEIAAPELDQQLARAVAARAQMAASAGLADVSTRRWEDLRAKGIVSQQGFDERQSASIQARASLAAGDAEVLRLKELVGFKRVLAPFDGVVTQRNVNVGDLVGAARGGAAPKPLFVLTRIDALRVLVNVPQVHAAQVRAGQAVTISLAGSAARPIAATVARTAGAIDVLTRTLPVEIGLPNADRALLPGAFVQVSLQVAGNGALLVPANTLLFRPDGVFVAVAVASAGAGARVHLRRVALGRDLGSQVEVLQGLAPADQVILNPPETVAENDVVAATATAPAPTK